MRWTKLSPLAWLAGHSGQIRLLIVTAISAVAIGSVLLSIGASDQKRLSIYSGAANYTLNVSDRDGKEYVDLLEILQPLGATSTRTDGSSWRLRFGNLESEFTGEKTHARIRNADFDLAGKFKLENGRGFVPLASLSTLLPQFLGSPVTFRESSRRLFIGNLAVHFTAQVHAANPPSLVMEFSSPVNPMIATEPGKLRMIFTHEPLVPPGSQTLTFDSKIIPSANYAESNGAAEIAVNSTVPLLASFSNDGRTITIAPAPQRQLQASLPPPEQQPASTTAIPAPQAGAASSATNASPPATYFAVVDASHGGEERGAALSDQLSEKDVTLAFARRLKQELEAHGLNTQLLRDSDVSLTVEQRAILTNAAHPAVYICLHATSEGNGVRLYTAMLPAGAESRGPFLDWDTAQSASRAASQMVETSLATELEKRQVSVRSLVAPLRPLNNITGTAIAIEIAPPTSGIAELNAPQYQQLISESVTTGLLAVREKLGAVR
jgi:N-acetylmuramoyl-L-alanine amidase